MTAERNRKKGQAMGVVYVGIGPEAGKRIEESEAFRYALEQCLFGSDADREEFRKMLPEWYFSGNYKKEEIADE